MSFVIEVFTLFALGVMIILIRTYTRVNQVGFRNLDADDYLMPLAIIPYAAETAIVYLLGTKYHGLTNSSMTDEERAGIPPGSEEYQNRMIGSKLFLAGSVLYATTLWMIKGSLGAFYLRLTVGLDGYRKSVYIGLALIITSYITTVCFLLLSCRPFFHLWQINPAPEDLCQASSSKPRRIVTLVFNVGTDLYLFVLPLPMLWAIQMRRLKKVGLMMLFSGGTFVIVASIIGCVVSLQDPVTAAEKGASWATRECFMAVATSNLSVLWVWFKQKLRPFFGSLLSSDRSRTHGPEPGSILLHDQSVGVGWHTGGVGPHAHKPVEANLNWDHQEDARVGNESQTEMLPPHEHKGGGITKKLEYMVSFSEGSAGD